MCMLHNGYSVCTHTHTDPGRPVRFNPTPVRENGVTLARNTHATAFGHHVKSSPRTRPEFHGERVLNVRQRRSIGVHDATIDPVEIESLSHHSGRVQRSWIDDSCRPANHLLGIAFRPPPIDQTARRWGALGEWRW